MRGRHRRHPSRSHRTDLANPTTTCPPLGRWRHTRWQTWCASWPQAQSRGWWKGRTRCTGRPWGGPWAPERRKAWQWILRGFQCRTWHRCICPALAKPRQHRTPTGSGCPPPERTRTGEPQRCAGHRTPGRRKNSEAHFIIGGPDLADGHAGIRPASGLHGEATGADRYCQAGPEEAGMGGFRGHPRQPTLLRGHRP